MAAALLIRPLVEYFKQQLLVSGLAATDDTRVTLLLPQNRSIPPPIEGNPKSQRIHEVFQAAIDQMKPSVSARMWAGHLRGTAYTALSIKDSDSVVASTAASITTG